MPYLITTRRFANSDYAAVIAGRRAVATLDEAADAVEAIVMEHDADTMPAVHAPDLADGGTIGPLPNGTTIEVAPVEWTRLAELAGVTSHQQSGQRKLDSVLLRAYNNAQVTA